MNKIAVAFIPRNSSSRFPMRMEKVGSSSRSSKGSSSVESGRRLVKFPHNNNWCVVFLLVLSWNLCSPMTGKNYGGL